MPQTGDIPQPPEFEESQDKARSMAYSEVPFRDELTFAKQLKVGKGFIKKLEEDIANASEQAGGEYDIDKFEEEHGPYINETAPEENGYSYIRRQQALMDSSSRDDQREFEMGYEEDEEIKNFSATETIDFLLLQALEYGDAVYDADEWSNENLSFEQLRQVLEDKINEAKIEGLSYQIEEKDNQEILEDQFEDLSESGQTKKPVALEKKKYIRKIEIKYDKPLRPDRGVRFS